VTKLALTFLLAAAVPLSAQQQSVQQASTQQPTQQPKGCLTVVNAGSHAFRNIMLGGLAGAVISKAQYKVVDSVNYPAHEGQKFHGNDLQTMQAEGVRVTVLDKKYTEEDVAKARTFCTDQK